MSITVHDCLNLPSFHSSKLIAGKKGLDRIVSSVSVVEIPEANQEIKVFNPNELSLSAFFAIKDDAENQCLAIKNLAESGVVALVLFYVGKIIPKLSPIVIQTADELSMPLILIRDKQIKYSDIITDVMTAIVKDQLITDNFITTTKNRLMQIPESKRDMNTLLNVISSSYKCNLTLSHTSGIYFQSIYRKSYGIFDVDFFQEAFHGSERGYASKKINHKNMTYYIYKQDFYHSDASWLTMYASCSADQLNETTIEDICTCTDFFTDLWGYSLNMDSNNTILSLILKSSETTAEKYIQNTDISISSICTLIIFDGKEDLFEIKSIVTKIFNDYDKFCIADIIDNRLVVLTSISVSNTMDTLLVQDLEKIAYNNPNHLCFFMNNDKLDIPSLRNSYSLFCANSSAMDKIFLNRKYRDMHDVVFTNEVITLLHKKHPLENHINFIIDTLQNDNDNLMETLAVYLIDCDAQLSTSAATLYLHRNTVSYRINKIKQLVNADFTKMPATYEYYLAAALWRLKQ